jgi:ABC-type histidine transport system ATPase subunit
MIAMIEIEKLRKSYGERFAVDGISLTARAGEIFGLLGRRQDHHGGMHLRTADSKRGPRESRRAGLRTFLFITTY